MNNEFNSTTIGILLTVCNKYEPGEHPFQIQSLVGLQNTTNVVTHTALNTSNILNEDVSALPVGECNSTSVIKLPIPFEVSRRYPLKFIPQGTRFIISFSSGDITKPRIIGGEF